MSESRRLAAIMFTDIVGYTSMMQRNEQEGLAKVRLYKEKLELFVKKHHGEILQHYGDGSLTIFSSAVEAVRCAKILQEELMGKVPLKVGMHIGDIVMEDDNIYGDGINLASRIESLGQEGTVFFSKNIYDKIRNLPEFQMSSLGIFTFKNVKEPLEVYALSNEGFRVPKRNELKGKLAENDKKAGLKWAAYIAIGVCLLAAFWFFALHDEKDHSSDVGENSIAVLPFNNLNKDEEGDFFCEGIMEDILINLSKIKDLKVISRTSAMHYKNSGKKTPEIAKELGVAHLVEGSLRKSGNKARINVQLVRAENDQSLWAENYDRDLADVFTVQGEVSRKIVDALQVTLSAREVQSLAGENKVNKEAYELFLKGKRAADSRTEEGLAQSVTQLKAALEIDETFAAAYANLAFSIFLQGRYGYIDPDLSNQDAIEMAQKALSFDENNADAYSVLAGIYQLDADLVKTKELFDKALSISPNSITPNHGLGMYYAQICDLENEIAFRKKVAELDPLTQVYRFNYIETLLKMKQTDQARVELDKMMALFPNSTNELTFEEAMILIREKKYAAAIPLLERFERNKGRTFGTLGYVYGKAGQRKDAESRISQIRTEHTGDMHKELAMIFMGLGEVDSTLHHLQTLIEEDKEAGIKRIFLKSFLKFDHYFEDIQEDGRLIKLLDELDVLYEE